MNATTRIRQRSSQNSHTAVACTTLTSNASSKYNQLYLHFMKYHQCQCQMVQTPHRLHPGDKCHKRTTELHSFCLFVLARYACYTSDNEELVSVDPCANWFSLCLCDPGCVGFVKRLSAKAPGARHDVRAQYAVEFTDPEEMKEIEGWETERRSKAPLVFL